VVQIDGAAHRVHDVDECTLRIVDDFLTQPALDSVAGGVQRPLRRG
jgi:hypothetical protein